MSKTSVDLEKCVSIDAMAESGHDISMEALPADDDVTQRAAVAIRRLYEVAVDNPRACLLLLALAVGETDTAKAGAAVGIKRRQAFYLRRWIKRHHPDLSPAFR